MLTPCSVEKERWLLGAKEPRACNFGTPTMEVASGITKGTSTPPASLHKHIPHTPQGFLKSKRRLRAESRKEKGLAALNYHWCPIKARRTPPKKRCTQKCKAGMTSRGAIKQPTPKSRIAKLQVHGAVCEHARGWCSAPTCSPSQSLASWNARGKEAFSKTALHTWEKHTCRQASGMRWHALFCG